MEPDASVALVCGGLSAPGRAVSAELLKRGWAVVVQDTVAELEVQAARLGEQVQAGDRLAAFEADLGDENQREDLLEFALEAFGRVDLLVGPAPGAGGGADLLELSPAEVAATLEADVLAPLFLAQRTAREMIRLIESETIEAGKIIFLTRSAVGAARSATSLAGLAGASGSALARLFAGRLAEYGINVYELRLGAETGILADAKTDAARAEVSTPLGRPGRPRDLALAVGAIAEEALSFTTGQTIDLDGGMHLHISG